MTGVLAFCLVLSVRSASYYVKEWLQDDLKDLKKAKRENKPPFAIPLTVIRLVKEHITPGEPVFFYMFGHLRRSHKHMDQSVIDLNYLLYPSPVYYRNNSDLKRVQWLVSPTGTDSSVRRALAANRLRWKFKVIDRNKNYWLWKRR